MTHEELLAKINKRIAHYIPAGIDDQIAIALRAVVELHKPTEVVNGYPYGPYCEHEVSWEWPCPTIQAIEKELS